MAITDAPTETTEETKPVSEPHAPDIATPSAPGVERGVSLTGPSVFSLDGDVIDLPRVPLQNLIEMRQRDGQVRALLRLITVPIRAAARNPIFIAAEGGDTERNFIEDMFTQPPSAGGMTITFSQWMGQILLGLVDGFSCFEQVFQVPDFGPMADKWTLKKMARRPSNTVKIRADESGDFNGLHQIARRADGHVIDTIIARNDSWYFAANEEENPFYGVSFFEPAFYHYDKKIKLYLIAHLAAQWKAVPGRKGHYPPTATANERAEFLRGISDFAMAQAIILKEGYDFDELNGGGTQFDFLGLIQHHNEQMSRSVLAQFLDQNTKEVLVDFSSPQDSMYNLMLESVMADIEERINNTLIPKFIQWNFGTDKYPRFTFGQVSDNAKSVMHEIFKSVVAAATLQVSPEFVFQLEKEMATDLSLDIDYAKVEAEREEAKIAEKELAEAQQTAAVATADASEATARETEKNPMAAGNVRPSGAAAGGALGNQSPGGNGTGDANAPVSNKNAASGSPDNPPATAVSKRTAGAKLSAHDISPDLLKLAGEILDTIGG